MTKEELEKEADKYATENYEQCIYDDVIGWKTDYEARKQAYLAGAEPREKRIANLGSTNKKISDECHKLVNTLEKKQNKNELLETQNIKLQAEVSRLTIKNAELKRDNEVMRDGLGCKTCVKFAEKQLVKAKELLTRFVMASVYFNGKETDLVAEAEQFLKECE